ncbi:MAG: excinuclease ABC subunit UvrA [Acidobacteria bacterium]|nr:MAG: excinuclease ABC subunit UvrA [Acidobacteriota bacterium]REK11781.1 MAG: excinuclease ABC subunit UvrA [Acidobacteriota bacterium]
MDDKIRIKGAREHNLKNVSLELPRNQLVVITGVSGSGKSSLAFDTLFAEGQRRYVESLSAYARQFLNQAEKPDVDAIEGLSPAISIEQKTVSRNPRSTVGTVTEIYDYLRLLYASIGVPHCPQCGEVVRPQTVQQMVDRVMAMDGGTRLLVLAPYVRGKKGEYKKQLAQMTKEGFLRARIDGETVDLSDGIPDLDKKKKHDIDLVIDRLVVKEGIEQRLAGSFETALKVGKGLVVLAPQGGDEETLSENYACARCGTSLSEITPRLFSFNSPFGACDECSGLGTLMTIDEDKVLGDPEHSIQQGVLLPWPPTRRSWRLRMLRAVGRAMGFDLDTPWQELSAQARKLVLFGTGDREMDFEMTGKKSSYKWRGRFEGVIPGLERRYRETESQVVRAEIEKFMSVQDCPGCKGRRLRPEALAVTVGGEAIDALCALPVSQLRSVFAGLDLDAKERQIAGKILQEVEDRLGFLHDVGVGYLSLERSSGTLSGGESQRIRLATQVGSKLMGVLYVLDEPSIGLHQRDNERLLATLKGMRDLGNSVLVVEHDEDTMREADWIVDLGPGAGEHGGEVVAAGTFEEIVASEGSLTGSYLRGELEVEVPEERREGNGKSLRLSQVSHNNLKRVDVDFPLGCLISVTGVSGSGKSSLVHDVLYKALARHFYRATDLPGEHGGLDGLEHLDKVIAIDQSPIGRTPRSNPATYTNVFGPIRTLMAKTPEARARGYKPGRFSFNVKGGRCEACQGDGQLKIEMHFLPDIYVTCDVCGGARYGRETLQVRYKGLNIAEILDLSVERAREVFQNVPSIDRILRTLDEVGLGYIRLGQPATTLSGGEAQRVKLATELCKRSTGRTFYLLDEPTTGLHFDDVKKLVSLLQRLVDKGNTVLVVEHNLDVIKTADWVIDLGPEGGDEGGEVVATGTPEQLARVDASHTGRFLARVLGVERKARRRSA